MAKKDLEAVGANLAELADRMPAQRSGARAERAGEAAPAEVSIDEIVEKLKAEEVIQFSLSLRKSLRKELSRSAAYADMTMRAFVLSALRDKGIGVTEEDLKDLRKRGGEGR